MVDLPETMAGMVLTGHGGPEKLEWRADLAVPRPDRGEVLIAVGAAALNNTDINTRTGWYSKSVRGGTGEPETGAVEDGGWAGAIDFPRIQGADCCGRIVAVGNDVSQDRIGERVLVRALQRGGADDGETVTFGSESDGAFAEYSCVRARDAVAVESDLEDAELASFPCAWSTAEGMLARIDLRAERVLITGASGGVGLAAVQLARRRGAHVTAVTSAAKADAVTAEGADAILGRDDTPKAGAFDVAVDLVAGPGFGAVLDALKRGGRYVTAGAIAGPIVELDVRTLYLHDLTLRGSTFQPDHIFTDLVRYIEAGEVRPVIAGRYALSDMAKAQDAFAEKRHVGKIVFDRIG